MAVNPWFISSYNKGFMWILCPHYQIRFWLQGIVTRECYCILDIGYWKLRFVWRIIPHLWEGFFKYLRKCYTRNPESPYKGCKLGADLILLTEEFSKSLEKTINSKLRMPSEWGKFAQRLLKILSGERRDCDQPLCISCKKKWDTPF